MSELSQIATKTKKKKINDLRALLLDLKFDAFIALYDFRVCLVPVFHQRSNHAADEKRNCMPRRNHKIACIIANILGRSEVQQNARVNGLRLSQGHPIARCVWLQDSEHQQDPYYHKDSTLELSSSLQAPSVQV